jgi:hypothetical protein
MLLINPASVGGEGNEEFDPTERVHFSKYKYAIEPSELSFS